MDDTTARIVRDLGREVAELRRRLAVLESTPRVNNTSVRDGWLRFFPAGDADWPVLYLGNATPVEGDSNSDVGLFVNDEGPGETFVGTVGGTPRIYMANDDAKLLAFNLAAGSLNNPRIVAPWVPDPTSPIDAAGRPQTTGTTYDLLWRTWMTATCKNVGAQFYCALGGGVTSMAVRVRARLADTSDPFQVVTEVTGITSASVALSGNWPIPPAVNGGDSVLGCLVELAVEARITGGTGACAVAPVIPAIPVPA